MDVIQERQSPAVAAAAVRHLISVRDLSCAELALLVDNAVAIGRGAWRSRRPLAGQTVGIYFRKSSTRTRTSFTVGAQKLGAHVIVYGPRDLQIVTGESIDDTARVLANFLEVPAGDLADACATAALHGARIEHHHDLARLPLGVDAVYTTRWLTMGVQKSDADWLDRFRPYAVTREMMERVSKPGRLFLHDLPAMRGYEVVDEVLDGPQSIAVRQALHKLTSAMSVLAWSRGAA